MVFTIDNGTPISVPLIGGVATLLPGISNLEVGAHTVSAVYGGERKPLRRVQFHDHADRESGEHKRLDHPDGQRRSGPPPPPTGNW